MSLILPVTAPCAKGAIPFALEEISRRTDGNVLLSELKAAILAAAPRYHGLHRIFDQYLVRHVFPLEEKRARISDALRRHWFGPNERDLFFPNFDVARIYAEGTIRALDLSLRGHRRWKGAGFPTPITAWWIVDQPTVQLLTFATMAEPGATREIVELLILTPRPVGIPAGGRFILRRETEVWVSGQEGVRCLTGMVPEVEPSELESLEFALSE